MKNLVIVESPSKSKTIEKYLGKDYKVLSSKGHIRDLATSGKYGLGVDLENNFKPNYILMKGKAKLVNELKKEAKNSDNVILATDPDREGEAISWHLKESLDIDDNKYGRVVFNEITEPAIKEAFNNPRKIDEELVHSQESRRILDRIIGFRLSKLMQSKTDGKSAGRVQSVALKLIVDREREIEAFISEEYYTIEADFKDFKAELKKYRGKDIEIKSSVEADEILSSLSNAYNIDNVEKKLKNKKSKLPFTTSTLTQMASNRLGYSASKTMSIAQKLYEGVSLANETVGLITYMRTDSIRFSDIFVSETKKYISSNYGKEYIGYAKSSKSKDNVQDAHEAIRPTSIYRTPQSVKMYLKPEEYKLYCLIYNRALASLMADAKVEATSVDLENNGYIFRATGQIYVFDGYLKVYSIYEDNEDTILPDFANYKSKVIVVHKVYKIQHFTEPKARFTEATLIAELEKLGIGRPSTYSKIISVLKERKYVDIKDRKFFPSEVGIKVTDKLQEFFSTIINANYTADMETKLDEIAESKLVWYEVLDKFYKDFEPLLDSAFKGMEKDAPEETGEKCPLCSSPLVYRNGKYGKFVACSNYPTCKYIKKEEREVIEICPCPKCNNKIVEKKTKKGKTFYGCNNYPSCKYALWDKPTGEICDKCGGLLVDKKGDVFCPECDKTK
ncbi:MAG: type I DNA topoisomerase [Tenericutes bacterium]|nr:type I DNA topoisomerase [Mycoplasmatota bacterium]